eukprot:TRINITY_DN27547_c0_g1_i1.p1 TRINITY_DN27547_c0_g1~~TRINITY_DN27547_c0_g1_i1.p1  ORF type:complete len:672 (-),score=142.71 TRINITY_DN27547_c0_g1_i1:285-2300(-)
MVAASDTSAAGSRGASKSVRGDSKAVRGGNPVGQANEVQEKELEVLVAEMETRIRSMVLKVIRPSLSQVADINGGLEALSTRVKQHDGILLETEKLREEVRKHQEMANVVTEQLDARDRQLRDFEMTINERVSELRLQIQDAEGRLEGAYGDIRKQGRETARIWEEATRLQRNHEETTNKLWDGINASLKRTAKNTEELMEYIKELQRQRDEMVDDLFGENKGLSKIKQDLAILEGAVAPVAEMEGLLQRCCEDVCLLKIQLTRSNNLCSDVKREVAETKKSNEVQLEAIRQDFRFRANQLTAHHAEVMKGIRLDYSEEIAAVRRVRQEIADFQTKTDAQYDDLAKNSVAVSRRLDALHKELTSDIDEVVRRRKRERTTLDAEMKEHRREREAAREFGQMLRANVEFLGRIVRLVLEGERLTSAVLVQDFGDRRAERWLCMPADAGRRPQPFSVESLADEPSAAYRQSSDPIPLDIRKGLSYDYYAPGEIQFHGKSYQRRDLLLLHHKLLQKAEFAYDRGPWAEHSGIGAALAPGTAVAAAVAFDSPSVQPGANGGAAAGRNAEKGKLHGKLLSDYFGQDSEDASAAGRDTRDGLSRQRPGSQGQPQAVGSRGAMSGSLGETEPPMSAAMGSTSLRASLATADPLRLPSIGGDVSGSISVSMAKRGAATAR